MISRRGVVGAGVGIVGAAIAGPALAKPGDLSLPPKLSLLSPMALSRADGTATTLGENIAEGRATVVSLWATWCGPCSDEAAHLTGLRAKITAEKLDIVGINIDTKRDEQKIAAFLKRAKVNFLQLRGDPPSTYIGFGGQLPISLPRLYVFTPAGTPTKVFGRYDGRSTLKAIDAAIDAAVLSPG